jgi:hypothetical protein
MLLVTGFLLHIIQGRAKPVIPPARSKTPRYEY